MIKFVRRKSNVERYNRAIATLEQVSFPTLRKSLEDEIKSYDIDSKIIEFFCSNPNTKTEDSKSSKDGKIHTLEIKTIGKKDGKYFVYDNKFSCIYVGENYVDARLNIGKDYHSLHLTRSIGIDYWYTRYNEFLLEQLLNQDRLEEMCNELNIMEKSYFSI